MRRPVFFFDVLNVELEVSRPAAAGANGARVRFRLVVTNTGHHAIDLYLRGREPTLEVVVARESGEIVWSSLQGVVIPASLQLVTLAARESLDVSAGWDQQVDGMPIAAGTYLVRASLLAEDARIEAREQTLTMQRD